MVAASGGNLPVQFLGRAGVESWPSFRPLDRAGTPIAEPLLLPLASTRYVWPLQIRPLPWQGRYIELL